jgi:hypothetical protein
MTTRYFTDKSRDDVPRDKSWKYVSEETKQAIESFQDEVERVTGHRPCVYHQGSGWFSVRCQSIGMSVDGYQVTDFQQSVQSWERRSAHE